MEDNRIIRRARPRPYDLRRKVLLKNFLREQMTYIPPNQLTSITPSNDSTFSEESSNSSEMDLQDLNDENDSCSPVSSENMQSDLNSFENVNEDISSDSNTSNNAVDTLDDVNDRGKADDVNESKIFKFTSLIKLKRKSNKIKGVLKAKQKCKSVKHPVSSKTFRGSLEKAFSKGNRLSKGKLHEDTSKGSKSLLSLFKSRKEMRKLKKSDNSKKNTNDDETVNTEITKCNTINQSVQTDESWTRDELNKVEQSNRLLREENRLLSESLSYFMSSTSIDSQVSQSRDSRIQSPTRNYGSLKRFPSYYSDLSSIVPSNNSWNSRSKIFRSKSVQEHGERRVMFRNNYRTRSMSSHTTQSNFYSSRSTPSTSLPSTQPLGINIPRVRKKNILANLPVNSSGRVVRRSSMPERILPENERSRNLRRSDSFRSTYRRPFNTLPSDAYY